MNTLRVGLVKDKDPLPQELMTCCIWGGHIKHPYNLAKLNTHAENCIRKYRNWGYDRIDLYVTRHISALVAVINACRKTGMTIVLFYYNKTTGDWISQEIVDNQKDN